MGRTTIHTDEHKRLTLLLRDVRRDAGLRQIEVAEKLGRHQSFVSKYESGERRLDLIELGQVCEALGVSLLDFVGRFEDEHSTGA